MLIYNERKNTYQHLFLSLFYGAFDVQPYTCKNLLSMSWSLSIMRCYLVNNYVYTSVSYQEIKLIRNIIKYYIRRKLLQPIRPSKRRLLFAHHFIMWYCFLMNIVIYENCKNYSIFQILYNIGYIKTFVNADLLKLNS